MPDAVNTNSLEYKYLNAGPGSVAAGSSAVGQSTESSHAGNNPAFATASELTHGKGQQGSDVGNQDPEGRTPAGGDDTINPVAGMNSRDQGPAPTRP